MARKDILLRYSQAENSYLEMHKLIEAFKKDLENNLIDTEAYENSMNLIQEEMNSVKLQYLFWAEAVYELNKPNRKSKSLDSSTQEWYNTLHTATKEIIKDDSKDAFKTLKSILKETYINGQN